MKIGIDGYEANVFNRVGIGRYSFELLKAIYEYNLRDDFKIFLPGNKKEDLPKERENWKYQIISNSRLWTFWTLPKILKSSKFDVFFSPTHYVPFSVSCPKVFSIMDLSYVYFPNLFRIKDLLKLRLGTYYSVKSAKKILTISNFTKNAIIDYYKVSDSNIEVTYPGFDQKIFNSQVKSFDADYLAQKYGIKDKYLIYVGTLQPRKNITRLLKAITRLEDKHVNLILVGKKGWFYQEFFKEVNDLKLENRVIFTDFVEDDFELARLITGSCGLVLPSLYEGFGIPAIEAIACGTQVVISQVSSLPEIVGKAGIYVNPYSIDDIARGISDCLLIKNNERKTRQKQGWEHIKKFTWRNCAQKTIEVIRSLE